ncbi:hypothetical protein Hanom_Chr02g00097321 [Helianthus anomalus]
MKYSTQRTRYRTSFMNINERAQPLFMFLHLTQQTEFFVRVRLFSKRTKTNKQTSDRIVHEAIDYYLFGGMNQSIVRGLLGSSLSPSPHILLILSSLSVLDFL